MFQQVCYRESWFACLEMQDQFSQGNNYIKFPLTNLPLNVRLEKMTSAFYDSVSCK